MPRFVVRVGYDWVTPCFRDVEIEAADLEDANRSAIALAHNDPSFWTEAVECDGEAGPTEIVETRISPEQ